MIRRLLARTLRRRALVRGFIRDGLIAPDVKFTGLIDVRESGAEVRIGHGCIVEGRIVCETKNSRVAIGNNVYFGGSLIACAASITLGSDILVSYGGVITDSDNHSPKLSIRRRDVADWRNGKHDWHLHEQKPVVIQDGAWIGAHVMILKGVEIGEGAIIGAGSVVRRSVPAWTVVAGNPAEVIREIGPNDR
jgi:acetyltransferase-like isoleucine patch superfamily enzyme